MVVLAVPPDVLKKMDTLCCPGASGLKSMTSGSVPTETQESQSLYEDSEVMMYACMGLLQITFMRMGRYYVIAHLRKPLQLLRHVLLKQSLKEISVGGT